MQEDGGHPGPLAIGRLHAAHDATTRILLLTALIGIHDVVGYLVQILWLQWRLCGCGGCCCRRFLLGNEHQTGGGPGRRSLCGALGGCQCGCACWRPGGQLQGTLSRQHRGALRGGCHRAADARHKKALETERLPQAAQVEKQGGAAAQIFAATRSAAGRLAIVLHILRGAGLLAGQSQLIERAQRSAAPD